MNRAEQKTTVTIATQASGGEYQTTNRDSRPLGHYKLRRPIKLDSLDVVSEGLCRRLADKIARDILYGTGK